MSHWRGISEQLPRGTACDESREEGTRDPGEHPVALLLTKTHNIPHLFLKLIHIRETRGSHLGKASMECTTLSIWDIKVIKLLKQFPGLLIYV